MGRASRKKELVHLGILMDIWEKGIKNCSIGNEGTHQVSWGHSLAVVCGLLIAVASLVAEHRLSTRGLQQLQYVGLVVVTRGLQSTGLVASQHMKSSRTRDRTHVLGTGRQSLIHCTTREIPDILLIDKADTRSQKCPSRSEKSLSQDTFQDTCCMG